MAADYTRRISSHEARTGRIMILKSALRYFPPVGEAFMLSHGGNSAEVCVEAEPCTCRGPELPHEHYYIDWPGLQKGMTVEITATPGASGYLLSTRT